MGINGLTKFLKKYAPDSLQEIDIDALNGSKIAFDTSILIYQFVIAIRSTIKDIVNESGKSISHIHASIMKTKSFINKKICPIFVFDNKPPTIKFETIDKRSKTRNDASNLLESIDLSHDDKVKYLKQSTKITAAEMNECKEVLTLMGIPTINSYEEADPQCAFLNKKKYVDAVASEDMDLLTFGTKVLLRNMTKKKILKIELEVILKDLQLTYEQFVDLCILFGCDYCPTIPGVGRERAYILIKSYGSINAMLADNKIIINKKTITIPNEFRERYPFAKDYFINPPINKDIEKLLVWNEPKYEELNKLLKEKYSYKNNMLNNLVLKPLFCNHYNNLINKSYADIPTININNNVNNIDKFLDSDDDKQDADILGVHELVKVISNNTNNKL